MQNPLDVIIIGGGIIGLTSAYRLASAGMCVAVFDRSDLGAEASWAGAGILPPGRVDLAQTPIDRLRACAAEQMPGLSRELRERTGIDNGYWKSGGIEFLLPEDEYAIGLWKQEGIEFVQLDHESLQALEPHYCESRGIAYLLPEMAQVRNPRHMKALIAACLQLGVELHPRSAVESLRCAGERIQSICLADGSSRSAGLYLIAGGAWSESFLVQLGVRPGVHPVRGQIVLYRSEERKLQRIVILGKEYLVPRGDGLILVGSTEEPEAGFVKETTSAGIDRLKTFACQCVPALKTAVVEKTWAGLRPGSPDGMPFIGRIPGYENALVATGHFRAGVQLSLGTAALVHDLVFNRPNPDQDAFRLDRVVDRNLRPAFRS